MRGKTVFNSVLIFYRMGTWPHVQKVIVLSITDQIKAFPKPRTRLLIGIYGNHFNTVPKQIIVLSHAALYTANAFVFNENTNYLSSLDTVR